MTTRLRSCAIALLSFAAFGETRIVHAEGPADPNRAQSLFKEARDLVAAGRYGEACSKFEVSLALQPGIGTEYNLADCLERVGRVMEAKARFKRVAEEAQRAGQSEREEIARRRVKDLDDRGVADTAEPPEATVQPQVVPLIIESRQRIRTEAWSHVQAEYEELAKIEAEMRRLDARAAALAREKPRDPRARRLIARISELKESLRLAWSKANSAIACLERSGPPPSLPALGERSLVSEAPR